MIAIGFTTKYYTLWDVTKKEVVTKYEKYTLIECTYIKNISYSLDEVIKKYPGIQIDYNLKGTRNYNFTSNHEPINQHLFQFGIYEGREIIKCSDVSYIEWYYKNGCTSEANKSYCLQVLFANGYELREGFLYSPKEIELARQEKVKKDALKQQLDKGEIVLTITSNADKLGDVFTDIKNLLISFDEVKEYYYNGYDYYLPVFGGKAKRLKNKKVKVTLTCYEERESFLYIKPSNIEVVK